MRFDFRVIRGSDSRLHLLGVSPDHYTPMIAINRYAQSKVVEICGSGIGVNLVIIDDDIWSEKISMHVSDPIEGGTNGVFSFRTARRQMRYST